MKTVSGQYINDNAAISLRRYVDSYVYNNTSMIQKMHDTALKININIFHYFQA